MIHARNFKTSVPYARITAVCDPVGDAAAVAAKELDKAYTDYRDVMADDTFDGHFRCPDAKKDFPDFYDNVV